MFGGKRLFTTLPARDPGQKLNGIRLPKFSTTRLDPVIQERAHSVKVLAMRHAVPGVECVIVQLGRLGT